MRSGVYEVTRLKERLRDLRIGDLVKADNAWGRKSPLAMF